jgi:cytochrome b6-f complex iron-sulfur subunit
MSPLVDSSSRDTRSLPTRREFVSTAASALAASALAACGMPAGPDAAITGPSTVKVPLMAVGQTVGVDNVGVGGQGIAVTRLTTTSVVAVSRQCTHQGCTLALPGSSGGQLFCPCHGSLFTVQGSVVQGPATTPLRTFTASIDTVNNQVDITNA